MSNLELENQWALVTGASRGIGKAYSILLASKGCNLVITARTQNDLEELQNHVTKKFNVQCHIIVCDLSENIASEYVFKQLKNYNIEVNILISNAGIGCYGIFGNMDIDRQQKMMMLNVYNPVMLSHKFINQASNKNTQYYIVHIGSVVGYKPIPGSCVYNATKSFIVSFVKALNVELGLSWKNISATVVSPGATSTNFFKDANRTLSKINLKFMMSAEKIAEIGLRAILQKKTSVICGFRNKMLVFILKIIPEAWLSKSQIRE